MAFFNRDKKNSITGTAYIYSLLKMLTDAQQALSHSREQQIDRHLPKSQDGRRVPKLMEIDLLDGSGKYASTYSLARTNSIGLTKATITCSTRIVSMEMGDTCEEEGDEGEEGDMSYKGHFAHFHISPCSGGKNSLEMVLEFEQREPSETEERILESLDHFSSETVKLEQPKRRTGPFY